LIKILKKIINVFKVQKKNYQLILVCDGKKIKENKLNIEKFPNIKFKNLNTFSGPGRARNVGLKMSTGKWVHFLDSDDMINFKKILKLEKILLTKKKLNMIAFNFKSNDTNYRQKKNLFYSMIKEKNKMKKIKSFFELKYTYEIIFYFFKKSFLLKNKIYFLKGFHEDIAFLLKTILKNNSPIHYTNSYIYNKNFNKNSITYKINEKNINFYIKAFIYCIKYIKNNYKFFKERDKILQTNIRGIMGRTLKYVAIYRLNFKKIKKNFLVLMSMYNNKYSGNQPYDVIFKKYLEHEKI